MVDKYWTIWTQFCADLGLNSHLSADIGDPILLLCVFATQYRDGRLAPSSRPVQAQTVKNTLHSVGQMLSLLGAHGPCHNHSGKIDFRILHMLWGMKATNPKAQQVKPIPLKLLHQVLASALTSTMPGTLAVTDMAFITFFFLLHPGEYTHQPSTTTAFRCYDVQVYQNNDLIPWATNAPPHYTTPTMSLTPKRMVSAAKSFATDVPVTPCAAPPGPPFAALSTTSQRQPTHTTPCNISPPGPPPQCAPP
jgi:hypothetical protein